MPKGLRPAQDLDDRLRERLPQEHFAMYQQLHAAHFHDWKVRRVSNPDSLRGLRLLLFMSGSVQLQRTQKHQNSQPFRAYAAELGLPLDGLDLADPFSGLTEKPEREFSEPGAGFEMYLATELGWTAHGSGDTLRFSIEETLRNCLRENVRSDGDRQLSAFRSETIANVFTLFEVNSVVDALAQIAGRESAYDGLAALDWMTGLIHEDGTVDEDDLGAARQHIDRLLKQDTLAAESSGQAQVLFTMLGFLVDELVARSTVVNGMGFWFRYTDAALAVMTKRLPALQERIAAVDPDVEGLATALQTLGDDCRRAMAEAESPDRPIPSPPDSAWLRQLEATADQLRRLGHSLRHNRQLDAEEGDLVFSVSNALWRWAFFLDHRARQAELTISDITPTQCDRVVELVLHWLRRPWGIVTLRDMKEAFTGLVPGDEHDEVPRGFTVLNRLFATDVEPFLAAELGLADPERALQIVRRFIRCRYLVCISRHRAEAVTFAQVDDVNDRSDAAILVELFARWLYSGDDSRIDRLDAQPSDIVSTLRSGDWCDELLATTLLRREADVARRYRDDPVAFVTRMFRFDEPDFDVEEYLGFMPPEKFTFFSRGNVRPSISD